MLRVTPDLGRCFLHHLWLRFPWWTACQDPWVHCPCRHQGLSPPSALKTLYLVDMWAGQGVAGESTLPSAFTLLQTSVPVHSDDVCDLMLTICLITGEVATEAWGRERKMNTPRSVHSSHLSSRPHASCVSSLMWCKRCNVTEACSCDGVQGCSSSSATKVWPRSLQLPSPARICGQYSGRNDPRDAPLRCCTWFKSNQQGRDLIYFFTQIPWRLLWLDYSCINTYHFYFRLWSKRLMKHRLQASCRRPAANLTSWGLPINLLLSLHRQWHNQSQGKLNF